MRTYLGPPGVDRYVEEVVKSLILGSKAEGSGGLLRGRRDETASGYRAQHIGV